MIVGTYAIELIETLWNVNDGWKDMYMQLGEELIETLWNVNSK